jgi:hypothetical protein
MMIINDVHLHCDVCNITKIYLHPQTIGFIGVPFLVVFVMLTITLRGLVMSA